jgi:hypothetical protein
MKPACCNMPATSVAGTSDTQHFAEELLRERNVIAAEQVIASQQPTREPRLQRVRAWQAAHCCAWARINCRWRARVACKVWLCCARLRNMPTSTAEATALTWTTALLRAISSATAADPPTTLSRPIVAVSTISPEVRSTTMDTIPLWGKYRVS